MIIFDWILRNPYSDVQFTLHVQFCVHSQYACDKSDIKFVPIKWFVKYLNARNAVVNEVEVENQYYSVYFLCIHKSWYFTVHSTL